LSKWSLYFAFILFLAPLFIQAQAKDSLFKKLDSLSKNPDSVGSKQQNNTRPEFYNENTKITFQNYFVLLADDIKQQVTSPLRATSNDWLQIGAFGLLTTGFVLFVDKPANQLALNIRNESKDAVSTSGYITNFGGLYEGYTLAALAAYGIIFKKEKTITTTLLATQAYITAAAIETALKYITGRQRPSYFDPVTMKNSPTWHGPFYQFTKDKNGNRPPNASYTSFPSGHTTVAFAAATVFAMEYKDSRFVPIIAYSAASLIGLSRLIQNQHWTSDVLVGAALGYLCGRQVVNNYHRYSKIQIDKAKKKNTLSFTMNYSNGLLIPGIVYNFN
jgi:membrane-associated phospholipid phosphatase